MKKKKNSKLLNKIILVLFCLILYLGFKINEKKQWVQLPAISTWLPFENWFQFKDTSVSKNIEYYHLVDQVYTNGTNVCASIFDGIVLEVNETSVLILSDEGIQTTYGQLTNAIIKVDERVLQGQSIGTFEDSLTLKFSKDNQELTYEEAILN